VKLSLSDVKEVFRELLDGQITREQAENWAELCMKAFDLGDLTFEPRTDEELIWKAVVYLSGVAMKVSPNEYMEDDKGIREEFDSHWNR